MVSKLQRRVQNVPGSSGSVLDVVYSLFEMYVQTSFASSARFDSVLERRKSSACSFYEYARPAL